MKPLRLNKVIGIALGEQSLLAAELVATPGGKGGDGRPEVRQLAEFRYPDGVTPAQPAELGAALAGFLRDQRFTAKSAVVGLPAKWLVVKPKAVPPADPATLAEMLRLQAEGEFSAELKDLVYDYAADATAGQPKSVLLIATPRRYVDGATALCEAARLSAAALTPSAVALGAATAVAAGDDARAPIVMTISPGGTELTAQAGAAPAAIRHLRGSVGPGGEADAKQFIGELRRTVSTLPVAGGPGGSRQMVLWGAGTDDDAATALGNSLGMSVRSGDLPALGVDPNGTAGTPDAGRYAAAVALALSATGEHVPAVDFLHPRLAPPTTSRVPRWALSAVLAVVAVVGGTVAAYNHLQNAQARLDTLTKQLAGSDTEAGDATKFVNTVTFAKRWHGGDPRYLACLRDLAVALPLDGRTYATNLSLRDPPRPTGTSVNAAQAAKANEDQSLRGKLDAKTSTPDAAQQVVDRLKTLPAFQGVQLGQITEQVTNRERGFSFSVAFAYNPPRHSTTAAAAPVRSTAGGFRVK